MNAPGRIRNVLVSLALERVSNRFAASFRHDHDGVSCRAHPLISENQTKLLVKIKFDLLPVSVKWCIIDALGPRRAWCTLNCHNKE